MHAAGMDVLSLRIDEFNGLDIWGQSQCLKGRRCMNSKFVETRLKNTNLCCHSWEDSR